LQSLNTCRSLIFAYVSDVLMGCLVCNDSEIHGKLRHVQNSTGAVPGPFDCYLALRGLKTLHVRMDAAQRNALAIAEFLEAHPRVEKVIYPGLRSHANFELVKKQARGPGAMITFYVRGGKDEATRFLNALSLFILAESLGAVESLAESPALMTHASVPEDHKRACGIFDNLIRLSIGIEHVEDLIADLDGALRTSCQ
jgi:cystathionine gamma-lyase